MSQVLPGMKHSSVATLFNNLYQRPLDSTSVRVSLCFSENFEGAETSYQMSEVYFAIGKGLNLLKFR